MKKEEFIKNILDAKFRNKNIVILLIIFLWLLGLLISGLYFTQRWGHFSSLNDFFVGHFGYGILSLPISFAGKLSFSKYLMLPLILIFWPLVLYLHYVSISKKSILAFSILVIILLLSFNNWLISAVAMMGI